MVCHKCSKKLESQQLITPEFTKGKSEFSLSTGERQINQNMIISKRKFGFNPMAVKCHSCKGRVEGRNIYCHTCAYTKGLCEMCGVKVSDMKSYKFTDVDPKDAYRKNKMSEVTKDISKKIIEKKKLISLKKKKEKVCKTTKSEEVIDFTKKIDELEYKEDLNDEYDEVIEI